jgi:hypothetical protein
MFEKLWFEKDNASLPSSLEEEAGSREIKRRKLAS